MGAVAEEERKKNGGAEQSRSPGLESKNGIDGQGRPINLWLHWRGLQCGEILPSLRLSPGMTAEAPKSAEGFMTTRGGVGPGAAIRWTWGRERVAGERGFTMHSRSDGAMTKPYGTRWNGERNYFGRQSYGISNGGASNGRASNGGGRFNPQPKGGAQCECDARAGVGARTWAPLEVL